MSSALPKEEHNITNIFIGRLLSICVYGIDSHVSLGCFNDVGDNFIIISYFMDRNENNSPRDIYIINVFKLNKSSILNMKLLEAET